LKKEEKHMNTWKGAFVAVLMSGVVVGVLNGHLVIWTAVGAALGAILAARERRREMAVEASQNREAA
jgi:hypothetical protein